MAAEVQRIALPEGALLARYVGTGAFTDGYAIEVAGRVAHGDYVAAFYCSWLFKLERLLLAWLVGKPSTDAQARQLGMGEIEAFAAWTVEARAPEQLLLSDFRGRTRSWLMTTPGASAGSTRLHFGSAVVPVPGAAGGKPRLGLIFEALLGFHKLYSRALLRVAARRLRRARA